MSLVAGIPVFPPLIKLSTAALRLYSSSAANLFLLLKNKKTPPTIATTATRPTTTPAAIPALLGLLEGVEALAEALAELEVGWLETVRTIVDPPTVTTEGTTVADATASVVGGGVVDGDAKLVETCALWRFGTSSFLSRPDR